MRPLGQRLTTAQQLRGVWCGICVQVAAGAEGGPREDGATRMEESMPDPPGAVDPEQQLAQIAAMVYDKLQGKWGLNVPDAATVPE
jgi:hypothetical protein